MTELKTLKDLIHKQPSPLMNDVWSEDLKQEAIKWINAMLKKQEGSFCLNCGRFVSSYNKCKVSDSHIILNEIEWENSDITGAVDFIMYFFNISGDDLK